MTHLAKMVALPLIGSVLLLACQEHATQVLVPKDGPGATSPSWAVTTGSMASIESKLITDSEGDSTSISYEHPSAANFMVVFVSAFDRDEVTDITAEYNGTPLTKVDQSDFNDVRTALFVMQNPPSGTHVLEAFFTGGSTDLDDRALAVYSLANVAGMRDWSVATAIMSENTFQRTVDSSPGDLVLDHLRWRQPEIAVTSVGADQSDELTESRQHSTSAPGRTMSTEVTQTTTMAHGGNDAVYYAVSLQPQAEGAAPPSPTATIENKAIADVEGDSASLEYESPMESNLMVVFASSLDASESTVITVEYGTSQLTKVDQTGFKDIQSALFIMTNPPPGTQSLSATFTGGTPNGRALAVFSLSGTEGIRDWTVTSGNFSDNTMQLTSSSASADMVLDYLRWRNHTTSVTSIGTQQTQELTDTWRARQNSTSAAGDATSTTMSQSTTISHGGNDAVYYALSVEAGTDGIWASPADLIQYSTSGSAWSELLDDADGSLGTADISFQDSNHDVLTLAAALVCVRTGNECSKARQGVLDAIGTESGARWLAVGRNLGSYVIAADLLDLRADGNPTSDGTEVEEWIEGWLTKQLMDNNPPQDLRGFEPFHSGANAAAQEGFAFATVAAYLDDDVALGYAWDAFLTYACDAAASGTIPIDLTTGVDGDWAHDDNDPCAVNPAGTTKADSLGVQRRIDGAIIGDIARGGDFAWPPECTQYPWVGMEGFVPAALILHRAGYPAFEAADHAVWRALDYLYFLEEHTSNCDTADGGDSMWFNSTRAKDIKHLGNAIYGLDFPVGSPVGRGRTVGYTDWTHPRP